MIEEAKRIISDDEIYMSVNKNNLASLRVQEKNGAYKMNHLCTIVTLLFFQKVYVVSVI